MFREMVLFGILAFGILTSGNSIFGKMAFGKCSDKNTIVLLLMDHYMRSGVSLLNVE